MSCGEYQLSDKRGRLVSTVIVHDGFAVGFRTLRRIGDAPCAEPKLPAQSSPLARAWGYVKAELSLLTRGKVDITTYQARTEACRGCPRRRPTADDELGRCDACGCGSRKRARLATVKLWMPDATCPLKKW